MKNLFGFNFLTSTRSLTDTAIAYFMLNPLECYRVCSYAIVV